MTHNANVGAFDIIVGIILLMMPNKNITKFRRFIYEFVGTLSILYGILLIFISLYKGN